MEVLLAHLCHCHTTNRQQPLVRDETVWDVQLLHTENKVNVIFLYRYRHRSPLEVLDSFKHLKNMLYIGILSHLQLRTVLSNKPQDSVIGFSRQDYLSGGCLLIFALHRLFLSMFINRVIFHLLFLLLSWRPFGLFLFITLVSLWLALIVRCKVLFSRNDHFLWTRPHIRRD